MTPDPGSLLLGLLLGAGAAAAAALLRVRKATRERAALQARLAEAESREAETRRLLERDNAALRREIEAVADAVLARAAAPGVATGERPR